MVTQEVTINNEVGLHARPATFFIQKANEFKSGIWVEKDERRVNAKSLLGVLSLGITAGHDDCLHCSFLPVFVSALIFLLFSFFFRFVGRFLSSDSHRKKL